MNQVGKIGKINQKANKHIAEMFMQKGIYYCEACRVLAELGYLKKPCLQSGTNAHRHGRVWYRSKPELLWDFKQVIFACMYAHPFLDANPSIKEKVFMILRGKE